MQRIVLTGGPGSGKTTVLACLRDGGFAVGDDAARAIIRERKAAGLPPRPEPRAFGEQILAREITQHRTAKDAPMFFERSVVDAVGMLMREGAIDDAAAQRLVGAHPYEAVFLFPPWEAIYRTDGERDHSFAHSVRVHAATGRCYRRFGYAVVKVPPAPPDVRAAFVLRHAELTTADSQDKPSFRQSVPVSGGDENHEQFKGSGRGRPIDTR